MRIALIVSSLRLAGAEKQFCYTARALFDAGFDARVFYLGAGDHYESVLTEAGIPLCRIFNRNRPWLMLSRLIGQLANFKPDIVLASQFGDLAFAGPAGRLCGALVLGGVRSDGFYELRTSGRRRSLLLKSVHGLIANSYRAKDNLISKRISSDKISVVPNVIDLSDFDCKAATTFPNPAPPNRMPITAVGSLHPCKRFDRFLHGLALARQHEPALFGVIAGSDLGERRTLELKAVELGLLPGHLEFLGECNHIPALLAHSCLLISCSEYEGFPNVILEAMAARLPVLATPAGDAGRIIQDGLTGYLLQADSSSAMADCIVRLARNPRLRAQMGEAARNHVEQQYNISCLTPRLLSVFSDFARKRGKQWLLKMLEARRLPDAYSAAQISARELPASAA